MNVEINFLTLILKQEVKNLRISANSTIEAADRNKLVKNFEILLSNRKNIKKIRANQLSNLKMHFNVPRISMV